MCSETGIELIEAPDPALDPEDTIEFKFALVAICIIAAVVILFVPGSA